MPLMLKLLLIVQVVSALSIIALVLFQQGKGADMGSAFGTGSAGSLFGASGAANFLSRATKWAAVVFFATTAGLAYMSHKGNAPSAMDSGVMQSFPADRSVPQVPGSVPAAGSNAAVPSAPSSTPDASVPKAPAATPAVPAAPAAVPAAPAAAAPAAAKPAETPAAPAPAK